MTGHDYEQMIRKPFQVPDNIGAEKFHNAYMQSSLGKKEPVLIKMSAVRARDNSMYPKIEYSH